MRAMQFAAMTGLAVAFAGSAVLVTHAGPLNPPAGPVSSTYKTLNDVQPRTAVQSLPGDANNFYIITQPGSYYLTGNIVGSQNKTAIQVRASNVTIDLNGFTLDGGGFPYAYAIDAANGGPFYGLTVRNGIIHNWQFGCVAAGAFSDCLVEHVEIRGGVPNPGIIVGPGSLVRNCVVSECQSGVYADAGCRVMDCVVRAPLQTGFALGDGASALRCSCYSSNAASVTAFSTLNNGHIVECNVVGGSVGVDLTGAASVVERCKIGQANIGVRAQVGNVIMDNTINAQTLFGGQGIVLAQQDNRAERNHLYAFATGVQVTGAYNVVISNSMHEVGTPVAVTGTPNSLVAPVVTTAAALAANPIANTQQ